MLPHAPVLTCCGWQFSRASSEPQVASFPQFLGFLGASFVLILRITWPLWATAAGAHGSREQNSGKAQGAAAAEGSADGAGLPPLSEVRKEGDGGFDSTGAPATPEAAKTVGRKLLQEQARSEEPQLNLMGFEWKARARSRTK